MKTNQYNMWVPKVPECPTQSRVGDETDSVAFDDAGYFAEAKVGCRVLVVSDTHYLIRYCLMGGQLTYTSSRY